MAEQINVNNYGTVSDGKTDATAAIQKAINDCAEEGGGTVVFEAGTYLCGSIVLCSNLTLLLQRGAVLAGSPRAEDYCYFQSSVPSRMDTRPWRAFIFGDGLENLTIRGEGAIDGGGGSKELRDGKGNSPHRPYGLHLINCRNVTVRDISMRNSAFWMQRYFNCDDVHLHNLRVWNHCNKNNDGMDIDSCTDVIVSGCMVDSADDGICLKSEGERPCTNVTVTNCIVSTFASAIKLGTGSVGGFENIVVSNCVVRPSRSKEMHHPFSAWGGLAAIDLGNVDGGLMKNITIDSIAVDGVESPVFVRHGKRLSGNVAWHGQATQMVQDHTGKDTGGARVQGPCRSENIIIRGVVAHRCGPIAGIITGYENNPVRNIIIRDCIFESDKPGSQADLTAQPQWAPERYPCNRTIAAGTAMPCFGLYLRDIEGCILDNISFIPADGEIRPALIFDRVSRLAKGIISGEIRQA